MQLFRAKVLLVEGDEDKRTLPELVEANGIPWGETADDAIVYIKSYDGIEKLLRHGGLETQIKRSELEVLGIVVDGNDDPQSRWRRISDRCSDSFPSLPAEMPSDGLVVVNDDGLKLGVWIMPDNSMRGMLETFLAFLIPDDAGSLWKHANEAVDQARSLGAAVKDAHLDKARIHTWLAWQNPPGQQLHLSIKTRTLDPTALESKPFVDWFRRLYDV